MPGFTTHTGKIAVLNDDNIDTDRIIPARFLTRVTRTGYGKLLFSDVRGPDFVLDRPESDGATILVVGTNFGCGSSREHAVWAVQQAGFKAVISRRTPESAGYGDIFRQNSATCGLLLIELEPEAHAFLTRAGTGSTVTIDLPKQEIEVGGTTLHFDVNPGLKSQLIEGLDLIGTTLRHEAKIGEYERNDQTYVPTAAE
ncbi:MAG TPA: 3-isopropylmalate dehydratase small subunit [Fimbriimonas sp.]|nr:3-isopropylmalate dehydratase small subunit [Fimbriimonas sp.]